MIRRLRRQYRTCASDSSITPPSRVALLLSNSPSGRLRRLDRRGVLEGHASVRKALILFPLVILLEAEKWC